MSARAQPDLRDLPNPDAVRKVEPEVWSAFTRQKAQDVIVELVLPPLTYAPRGSGGNAGNRPNIWPSPPTSEDAGSIEGTFRRVAKGLRGIGIRTFRELRSAGSIVVRVTEDQVCQMSEWPTVKKIYANSRI